MTVTAEDDPNAADEDETLTHRASGGEYAGVSAGLAVRVTDDDTAGLVLSTSTLSVLEGDAAGAGYTVSLSHVPTVTVTVEITGHSGTSLSLSTDTLSFSTRDWNDARTVTVTAADDPNAADEDETLTHRASGGEYNGADSDLMVRVEDDAPESVSVSFGSDSHTVPEGATTTIEIVLSDDPERSVTIPIWAQAGPGRQLRTSASAPLTSTSTLERGPRP